MKALIINQSVDTDLILEDGSYAFIYFADDKIKVNLYQGRITTKLTEDNKIEDACLENSYKVYYKEYFATRSMKEVIEYAVNWLTASKNIEFTTHTALEYQNSTVEDYYETINKFLNL